MAISIPSISITYNGRDATDHHIDLVQLGASLQGAGKLLAIAATVAITGQYAKRSSALAVKVLASAPKGGSVQIVVDFTELAALAAVVTPYLPGVGEAVRASSVNSDSAGIPKRPRSCESTSVIAREESHGPVLQPGFA